MLQIGLTGGIGSGKSTVAALLGQCGATIIDTDAISKQLTRPGGSAIAPIRATFGDAVLDAHGGLDRARMRTLAFTDAQTRRQLESILHPLIEVEADHQSASATSPIAVFDVPLLVESGRWRHRVDRVLVIDCREATQIERTAQRAGWSVDAARAVIAQQASRQERRQCADAVIYNDEIPLGALSAHVHDLWQRWRIRAPVSRT